MRLIIVGAGGLASTIYSCFRDQFEFIGFMEKPQSIGELKLGLPIKEEWPSDIGLVIGFGTNPRRKKMLHEKYGDRFVSLVHPTCHISESVKTGRGNVFLPDVFVDPEATIGDLNTFMNGCFISHSARIADYCTIGHNVVVGGCTEVCEGTYIGSNAVVLNERYPDEAMRLGKYCRVGAGAVVVKRCVEDGETVVGVPARPLR